MRIRGLWQQFGIIVCLLGGLSSCAQPPIDEGRDLLLPYPVEPRVEKAKELMNQGDLARALTQWQVLATIEPDNLEFSEQLTATKALIRKRTEEMVRDGKSLYSKKKSQQAKKQFLRALALDPYLEEPLDYLKKIEQSQVRSIQLSKLDKLAQARKPAAALNEKKYPATSEEQYYLQMGIDLLQQGQPEESIREIQKYLNTYPDNQQARDYLVNASIQMGKISADKGMTAEALEYYEKARSLQADDDRQLVASISLVREQLAEEYYVKGMKIYLKDINKAIEFWETSLGYDANHTKARLQLNKAYKIQKNLKKIQ